MHANKQINVCRVFADFFGQNLKPILILKFEPALIELCINRTLAILLKTTLKYVKYHMI